MSHQGVHRTIAQAKDAFDNFLRLADVLRVFDHIFVLTGGGRMDLEVFRPLGEHLANAGHRVLAPDDDPRFIDSLADMVRAHDH